MLLLLLYDDWTPLFIFTASLPLIHTYTSNHKRTHFLLCSKLTGHILDLHAPWDSIPLTMLSLKMYLHSVINHSSVLSHGKGKPQSYYFYWMTKQHASIQLWAKGCGLWLGTNTSQIDYSSPLTAFYLFHSKSKAQIKPSLVFSVKVCFTLNRKAAWYSTWPHASCDPKIPVITGKNVSSI